MTGWRVGVCDVPLHIHIKGQKRQKNSRHKCTDSKIQMNRSLATRAGKQNLLVDRWVGELEAVKLCLDWSCP